MVVADLFSKRQARLRGEELDVYVYDEVPETLRVQILQVLYEVIGDQEVERGDYTTSHIVHGQMVKILRKERGVFVLPPMKGSNNDEYLREYARYFLEERDAEKCMDAVELACLAIRHHGPTIKSREAADSALEEINQRFREHGLGYEYDVTKERSKSF